MIDIQDIAALEMKMFRGNPPEQPRRFYRRTRAGRWLRKKNDRAFLELKGAGVAARISMLSLGGQ